MFWGGKEFGTEKMNKACSDWHLGSEGRVTQDEAAGQAGVKLCMALQATIAPAMVLSKDQTWIFKKNHSGYLMEMR